MQYTQLRITEHLKHYTRTVIWPFTRFLRSSRKWDQGAPKAERPVSAVVTSLRRACCIVQRKSHGSPVLGRLAPAGGFPPNLQCGAIVTRCAVAARSHRVLVVRLWPYRDIAWLQLRTFPCGKGGMARESPRFSVFAIIWTGPEPEHYLC